MAASLDPSGANVLTDLEYVGDDRSVLSGGDVGDVHVRVEMCGFVHLFDVVHSVLFSLSIQYTSTYTLFVAQFCLAPDRCLSRLLPSKLSSRALDRLLVTSATVIQFAADK